MINYHPLTQSVGFHDRLHEFMKWSTFLWLAFLVVAVFIAVFVLVGYDGWLLYYWILMMFVAAIIPLIRGYRRAGQVVRLKRFAEVNRLNYSADSEYDNRDGLIFRTGHSKKFIDLMTSNRHDVREFGNFKYVTGHGRSRQTHNRGFVRIELDRNLPHIVLDAKSNNFLGRISNLQVGFSGSQRLSLEGDFDNHFSLYAAPQYKTDALYVFTPDVMALMIDKAHAYDIEIIDNNLYLYSGKRINLTDSKQLRELFDVAELLRRRVNKQAMNYADERVGPRELNVVGDAGARMKTGLSTTTIIAAVAFAVYFIWRQFF